MAEAPERASQADNNGETSATAGPVAGAALEGGPLEGEDGASLVGIMYSERQWAVQPWMKASFFWVAMLGFAGLVAYSGAKRIEFNQLLVSGALAPEPWTRKQPPSIALPPGPTGEPVDLTQFRGKWVFVNFWATWCAPCRDEMPSMEMLNRRIARDNLPVEMVAISVDDDWAEVNRFFGATAPTFKVLWDRDKKTAFSFGTRKFPETFLLDPQGRVVAKFTGPRDWYNQGTVQYFEEVTAGRRKPT